MVPVLGRIAVAYGAGDAYRRVTTFFNEQFKEKGSSRDPTSTQHSQAPYTQSGGQQLADGFKQNLNKLENLRETIVYAIKERFTGKIMKFGETAAGYFKTPGKTHLLKRAQRQIDQAARRGDQTQYVQEPVKSFSSKKEARAFETQKIDQARAIDKTACPWNKGRH
jgi:hypothetical protein